MIKIGILGPVGSGKTTLIEFLTKELIKQFNIGIGIVTNDVVSNFDAIRVYSDLVLKDKILPKENVVGLVTGGCPHTAIREDPSLNMRAIETLFRKSKPDIIFIESGGDNVMSTFSPLLADYTIFVLDTSAGDKYPEKGGLGIMQSDLLVINKIDLAPYIGADLNKMREDAEYVRKGKPTVFISLKTMEGTKELIEVLTEDLNIEELLRNK